MSELETLRASARSGDPAAQRDLAWRLMRGEGLEKSPDEAVWWMGLAAGQDDVDAQYQLGVWLELLGRPEEAEGWVARAAEAGHAKAQAWLGA